MIPKPRYLLGQVVAYAFFASLIAGFSGAPAYHQRPPEDAVVKLSLTHPGQRLAACRQRSKEELAKLPPNMRAKQDCQRGRHAVSVAMDIDSQPAFRLTAKPSGLASDGTARFYDRRDVPAGLHHIAVRMVDSGRTEGSDHAAETDVTLAEGQVFVVDFDEETGQFAFK